MSVLRHEVRPGAYHDSIVLMQLRAALEEEPAVREAGAVMGSRENLSLLEDSALLPEFAKPPGPSDLVVVVRAETTEAAAAALERVGELLERDRTGTAADYRPRSLSAAVRLLPAARWVLVSVPGGFAAGVAREALDLGRHVFLFSDHVPLADEVELKRMAGSRGLLVMGPDCGTSIVRGVGFGFSNRVRGGNVGIVAASGTGLQAVACGIHARGGGISHAIGTGGRDLSAEVGGATALQALDLLSREPGTRTIVLVSKTPAPDVAERVLDAAEGTGKPVVVRFMGQDPARDARRAGSGALRFARGLGEAAGLAVRLSGASGEDASTSGTGVPEEGAVRGFLRGLFAGGTLAQEALEAAAEFLEPGSLHANLDAEGVGRLADPATSRGHAILDLGADAFTAGRPHPMLDQETRIRRLRREAADPETGLLLMDVVLGDGAHPDPAAELAPAIAEVRAARELEVVVILVGTDRDPQDLEVQASRLAAAGARVFRDVEGAMAHVRGRLCGPAASAREPSIAPVGLEALREPVAAINVGLEAFHRSLVEREVPAVHVEWRPPAGGDETLAAALGALRR